MATFTIVHYALDLTIEVVEVSARDENHVWEQWREEGGAVGLTIIGIARGPIDWVYFGGE